MIIKGNSYKSQYIRGIKRKLYLIDLRGGSCEKCGYNKNLSAFDFHHMDPTQKETKLDMRHLSNMKMNDILIEFEKCKVFCANCHREEHYTDFELEDLRKKMIDIDLPKSLQINKINKPKCCDCGKEINYSCKRCRECNYKSRRKVERPDIDILLKEVKFYGKTWCGKKYGVSGKTIAKWIKNI